ncbi:MAG: thermosome subunit beta [Promethearchaeati archaeon SRVP18_Atabeyarchaeia-1]
MSQTREGTPVLILKEGSNRSMGRDAQRSNIMAARVIGEMIKTSLGPKGMDKMLVDTMGDVTVTNDGATILKEMDVQHPAAKMMVQVAKSVDNEVGDGTTSAVVLSAALLREAEELMNMGIHPTVVLDGYRKGLTKSLEILDKIALPVDFEDVDGLKKIAVTSMRSKVVSGSAEFLADLAVKALKQITEKVDGTLKADINFVKVDKKQGGSTGETTLINGIILDKEVVHPGMPKLVKDAKIALLTCPLEVEKTEVTAKINITDPTKMRSFLDEETNILRGMVDKIKEVGANVVLCQKGIDDVAQHYLAKEGIVAIRRIKESDMEKLAKATGAKTANTMEDLTSEDLGYAESVEERKVGDDKMTFIEGCKSPKAVNVLIRGGTERIVAEAERAFHDSVCVVRDAIEDGKMVPGGGAPEIEVSRQLRQYADTLTGREQLAVRAFANATEVIPRTLAENAGFDVLEVMGELRKRHDKGEKWAGVNVLGEQDKIADMEELNVLEPLRVKLQSLKSATEAAEMILRIDDVIASGKTRGPGGAGKPPAGGAGGEED